MDSYEYELILNKLAEIRDKLFDESDETWEGHDMVSAYSAYPHAVLLGIEDKLVRYQNELSDWKDLFYLILADYNKPEHLQTHEWKEKSEKMGLEI